MTSKRELMGVPTTELSETIRLLAAEIRRTPSDQDQAKESMTREMQLLVAELERRVDDGGEVLTDIRAPHWTDGERLAAGMDE